MRPLTRERTSETLEAAAAGPKRQKLDKDPLSTTATASAMHYDSDKNSHLKGRKRFNADLKDLKDLCQQGYQVLSLCIKKVIVSDEEGSFEIYIVDGTQRRVISATFMISDTSEYPTNHSFFCHTDDSEVPPRLQSLLEAIVDERPRVLKDLIDWFCLSLANAIAPLKPVDMDPDPEENESGDESDMFDYDDDTELDAFSVEPNEILRHLQESFVDVVASSYNPGIIRTGGGNDFILSVSVPVISLTETIPPRALMAWDRRLLSRYQHLTLLISGFHGVYPILENNGTYTKGAAQLGASLSFKVGLTERYKPGKEQAQDAVRKHGLIINDAEDELRILEEKAAQEQPSFWDDDVDEYPEDSTADVQGQSEEVEEEDPDRFDRFSLTSSLESLFEQSFLRVVQLRRQFGLGWAGAETLFSEIERLQLPPREVYALMNEYIHALDKLEDDLARSTISLPHDPLRGLERDQALNLPLTAFSYLIRRLSLCTKYCVVCHNKLDTEIEALKPYVCGNKLCSFQYYTMGRGPSLEYEIIHNPRMVDLLVSLAYVSAVEGNMEDPLPVGLGLLVPHPGVLSPTAYNPSNPRFRPQPPVPSPTSAGDSAFAAAPVAPGAMVDFDVLSKQQMRGVIATLIDSLPSVDEMKKHLTRKVTIGKSKPKLNEIPEILPAAWLILRWIVGSCTAYIEEITSEDERIKNLDPNWCQFRLTVGAPEAEAKFKAAAEEAAKEDGNAAQYPALYAFHGSPLKNWHSIIRHGLWYKEIAHGRAYGNGVYLAKDGNVSMGTYAAAGRTSWRQSQTNPSSCMALTEVINLPHKFVSNNPYFVVAETSWILCRYLLVKGTVVDSAIDINAAPNNVPYVAMDPRHKATLNNKEIRVPDPTHQLETILQVRKAEAFEEVLDDEDMAVYSAEDNKSFRREDSDYHMDMDDDDDYKIASVPKLPEVPVAHRRPADDWKHEPEYVQAAVERLMVPPLESSTSATNTLQRELRDMLREQENAPSLRELGWYIPEDLIGDNLYQWIVELHSFDPDLPIAKDMKAKNINSIIFEIRFPAQFPVAPPFFRIITPRFLPFIHGGGGHVTGGGSICMDLLTADGWLPSYSIPAVLMQIKLAISNLEPRPARLSPQWQQPYEMREALEGFKRAAATHNWKVPEGLERLVQ